jgi:O-acetylhomoserine (thiol)-lyase
MTSTHPETLALHAGWRSDAATNAVAVPIYQQDLRQALES